MCHRSGFPNERKKWVSRFTWLIRIRWVALVLTLVLASVLSYLKVISELNSVVITLLVLIAFNLLSFLLLKYNRLTEEAGLKLLCFTQILGDIVGILALVHFTGGLTNPFIFFLTIPVILTGIFYKPYWTAITAIFTWGLAGLMGLMESHGYLAQHQIVAFGRQVDSASLHARMSAALLALGALILASAFVVCRIMRAFRRRERSLETMETAQQASYRRWIEAADQRREAMAGLAAGIASEIESPLGIVRARIDAMQYSIEDLGEKDGTLLEDLRVISGKVIQMEKTMGKIASFLRQHAPERVPLDVESFLQTLIEEFNGQIEGKNLACRLETRGSLPPVEASPGELKVLFQSLLLNALEALANKVGGEIRVSLRHLSRKPGFCVARVLDNGPGIDPEVQKKIFDPFFSTRSTDRGAGLAIAYTIVRNHGGTLRIRSRPPGGTSVLISLPLSGVPAKA